MQAQRPIWSCSAGDVNIWFSIVHYSVSMILLLNEIAGFVMAVGSLVLLMRFA